MDVVVQRSKHKPSNSLILKKINDTFCANKEILSIKEDQLNKKTFIRYVFKNKRAKEKWSEELYKQKAISVKNEIKTNYVLKKTPAGRVFLYQSFYSISS